MRLIVAAGLFIGSTAADDCAELCRRDSRCVRGSWCKGDAIRGSCHNFFYDSPDKSGSFHYHVHGMTSVLPILCGEARGLFDRIPSSRSTTTTAPPTRGINPDLSIVNMPVISVGVSTVPPITTSTSLRPTTAQPFLGITCSVLCESVPSCHDAGRGSYCKPNGTCTGLFFRTRERSDICYHQSGSDCPDQFPVTCDPSTGSTVLSASSAAPPTTSASTTRTPLSTHSVNHRVARVERPATDSLVSQVNGRRFRSSSDEMGVNVSFDSSFLRLEFTYRGRRTIFEGLEYNIEGNFVHLQRGGPLRALIDAVETLGTSITHHRHSAHHVTIHIVPVGTLQNDSTYVIVRLGDFAPATCTEF